jgi:hypothetical protein
VSDDEVCARIDGSSSCPSSPGGIQPRQACREACHNVDLSEATSTPADISAGFVGEIMVGSTVLSCYVEGMRGDRGMGIWAENAVWYDGCALWERLPRHG